MDRPHQRVAADLRRRITSGEWPPGEKLPSWRALADHYGVGQGAIRLAMDQLRADHLIEGAQRSRLHVAYPPAVCTLIAPDADWPYGVGDVEVGTCPAGDLGARLQCGPRARLVWRRTECLDPGGRPAMLVTTWQRGTRARPHAAVRCEVRPHALTAEEATMLGLATGGPALLIERTRHNEHGRPMQAADLVRPADRWRIAWAPPPRRG